MTLIGCVADDFKPWSGAEAFLPSRRDGGIACASTQYLNPQVDRPWRTKLEGLAERICSSRTNVSETDVWRFLMRPPEEFAQGHLPGALNIPLGQPDAQLHNLTANSSVVAHCRRPYCILSYAAMEHLRARGTETVRAEPDFPERKAVCLPSRIDRPGILPAGRCVLLQH